MNDISEATRKSPSKTYVRNLADGVRLKGRVSPCVFMNPGYPLQLQVTLEHGGRSLGVAYAVDRTKGADTYADADIEALLTGIRILPCNRCAAPAFDPESIDTNRAGLCESCFLEDLESAFARAAEAEQQELADRDRRMKQEGMKVRVSAWVHPEEGGDDYPLDWYLETQPTPEQVREMLRDQHSGLLDDFQIITL